jgi:hypothetical protein
MDDAVPDHVELEVTRNGANLVATHLDIDQGGQEAAGLDCLPQLVVSEGHELRLLLAAVDDAWNEAVAAGGPGRALAAALRADAFR